MDTVKIITIMSDMIDWNKTVGNINISERDTHIWLLPLELKPNQLTEVKSFLSEDELARAQKFYFDKQRNHYIAIRGLIRKLLGLYLNLNNKKIIFSYNEFGKPFLENRLVQFNLSHSHKLALFAVNINYELGVDIEWMHRKSNLLEIGERFFSENEFAELKSLPAELQRQGFFNCWTRKESYIKARGKGLAIPLSKFEVSLKPGDPVYLKSTLHDPKAINEWTLYAFDPHTEYTAAMTINTKVTKISFWDSSGIL